VQLSSSNSSFITDIQYNHTTHLSGKQYRDFIYVDDIVDGLMLSEKAIGGCFREAVVKYMIFTLIDAILYREGYYPVG
jgi:nucleoside-diphosphate-sugar epimerase